MKNVVIQPHNPAMKDTVDTISVSNPTKGKLVIRSNGVSVDAMQLKRLLFANKNLKGDEFNEANNEISW